MAGIEPATLSVLTICDNPYTTRPPCFDLKMCKIIYHFAHFMNLLLSFSSNITPFDLLLLSDIFVELVLCAVVICIIFGFLELHIEFSIFSWLPLVNFSRGFIHSSYISQNIFNYLESVLKSLFATISASLSFFCRCIVFHHSEKFAQYPD